MSNRSELNMMTEPSALNQELADWGRGLPELQKEVIARICRKENISEVEINRIIDDLIDGRFQACAEISAHDIPGSTAAGAQLVLTGISEVTGVNALMPGQTLSFGPTGLTVVFGNNGCGKSGYGRILREAVTARVKDGDLLGDVFSDNAGQPSARLDYSLDEQGKTWILGEPQRAELSRVRFFDADCGENYVTSAGKISFQPSALAVLDQLSSVCEDITAELGRRRDQIGNTTVGLPMLHTGTPSFDFLSRLSATTSSDEIDVATRQDVTFDDRLARLIADESRLKKSDPKKEQQRLESLAAAWSNVVNFSEAIAHKISIRAIENLRVQIARCKELEIAAGLSANQEFNDEPIDGVGSESWRVLWEAARSFSISEAYHEHSFPYVGGSAHCLLCQQPIEREARDRLVRFEEFVKSAIQGNAEIAVAELTSATNDLKKLAVVPAEVTVAIEQLKNAGEDMEAISDWLEKALSRVFQVLQWAEDGSIEEPDPLDDKVSLAGRAKEQSLRNQALLLDEAKFAESFVRVTNAVTELQDLKSLRESRSAIDAEVKRLVNLQKIDMIRQSATTNKITRKRRELAETHVTTTVREQFEREVNNLGLRSDITLDRPGKRRQDVLNYQPSLVGAKTAAAIDRVLSEGEQTALGLAGFITEAELDMSRSALVFDDPVSSMDSERRAVVASRLIELSGNRQVIVFTHEITFVNALNKALVGDGIAVTERSVQRKGGVPGHVIEEFPWTAKNVQDRIDTLSEDLNNIERDYGQLTDEDYSVLIRKFAGNLSETLERAIHLLIVNKLVDRGKNEVKPSMMKILPKFTQLDHDEYQANYHSISGWAPRHDNAPEENFVAPSIDEVRNVLNWFIKWQTRVKRYGN